jgi:serine/threonine-protein kinase
MSQREPGTSEETVAWSSDSDEVRDLTGITLGDFQVERLLGRGGMGQVYLATQLSLNRPVALKVLHPRLLSNPAYLSRFTTEAKAVAKLNHPNIVHIYMPGAYEKVRYIAMEYVEGTNLRDYMLKKGAIDLPLAFSIMRQAGQAIKAAGEEGLIHRDIKPENLLLTRKGRVKVADFGLCRDAAAEQVHVTQPGTTMGTPLYMSPEQAQGKPLDHRSDLYSLGVTFYHMLTGEPPFRADSPIALALKHINEMPISLRVRRPEIPLDLDRLVLKLMAKDPAERYQSAGELLADLNRIRTAYQATSSEPVSEEPPLTLTRSTAAPAPRSSELALRVPRAALKLPITLESLGRPRTLIIVGVLFLLVGAALGWSARPSLKPPAARRIPGLGIEPRWSEIPRQQSAEDQYRHAQFRAAADDMAAAWLAVPGNYPSASEWASTAYFQLARLLYRQRDVDHLNTLKADLANWSGAKTRDKELAQVLEAASKLVNRDLDGVIDLTGRISGAEDRSRALPREEPTIYDPGLLEFTTEIVADAIKMSSGPGIPGGDIKRERLNAIQRRLITFLRKVRVSEWAVR